MDEIAVNAPEGGAAARRIVDMALLERDPQLRAAAGWLAEAAAGQGRFVFLAGEAGVGKTVFVRRVAADAASARVAVGACDGVSTPAPLGPLVEMLAELQPGSGRRAPPARRSSPGWWRRCGRRRRRRRTCW